ncbi:MAG: hypothetical protein H0U74_00175, partial [Bradymonadaceae bacterium]|nr:hypothetical protein [Lujinxingiaceae bacterium]
DALSGGLDDGAMLDQQNDSNTVVTESCACALAQPSKAPGSLAIFGLLGLLGWRRIRRSDLSA